MDLYEGRTEEVLSEFFKKIPQCGFVEHKVDLIQQSYSACAAEEIEKRRQQRVANAINGNVVTDSESDDLDSYMDLMLRVNLAK